MIQSELTIKGIEKFRIVSITDMATLLNVSKVAVSKAVANGRISKGVRKSGSRVVGIDLIEGILQWFNNADLGQDRGNHQKPLADTKNLLDEYESRRMQNHFRALLEKVEYEKEIGLLVEKESIQKTFFDAGRLIRDRMLTIPEQICHELSSLDDPSSIRSFLTDKIEESLEVLSNDPTN